MSKPIVAVDVDDVLVPHEVLLAKEFRRYFDEQYSRDSMHGATAPLSKEQKQQVKEIMNRFLTTEEFQSIEPIEGAVQVMRQLDEHYKLVIVTARPKIIHEITKEWLHRHFPAIFNDIHFVNEGHGWGEVRGVSKREVCQQTGARYLIDDSLLHIQEAAECGISGLLFGDYSWNHTEELPPNTVRVKDWSDVSETLL